MYNSAIQSS